MNIKTIMAVALIALGIVFAVFGIPLCFNILLGATCACEIRTAVQTEELSSLVRLRQTNRVLDKIRPLIVAAQGQLTAAEVSARLQETSSFQSPTQPAEQPLASPVPPVSS